MRRLLASLVALSVLLNFSSLTCGALTTEIVTGDTPTEESGGTATDSEGDGTSADSSEDVLDLEQIIDSITGDYHANPAVTVLLPDLESTSIYLTEECLPDIATYISQEAGFAAVYDGYYKLSLNDYLHNVSNSSRAEIILGSDIYITEEQHKFPSTQYGDDGEYRVSHASSVTPMYAVMCIYKSLNKYIYDIAYQSYPSEVYTIDNTPLAQMITVPVEDIDTSAMVTRVYVSRSDGMDYWIKALDDGLAIEQFGSYGENPMTLGEFCHILNQAMYLYGEPVLTELEQNYLLEVYGRVLPYSLPEVQLSAVKNLMAKGIVLPEYDYTAEMSVELMLEILMRVRDVGSRQTFKNIQITYDPDLLSDGYYPTEATAIDTGIYIQEYNIDYSTATHYDYFVAVIDGKTQFRTETGEVSMQEVYVAQDGSNPYGSKLWDSKYMGIETVNGVDYYHFKIPVDTKTVTDGEVVYDAQTSDGYVVINSMWGTDIPAYYRLKYGGGFYETPVDTSNASQKIYSLDRVKFDDSHEVEWVDSDRKLKGISTLTEDVELYDITNGTYEVTLCIPDNMLNYTTYTVNGNTYPVQELAESGQHVKKDGELYTFTGLTSLDAVKTNLHINSADAIAANQYSSVETYQIYGKLGEDMLVSADYLKAKGAIKGYDWITDTILLLYSNTINVYIDTARHFIISGTTVYKVPDSTHLVYESGENTFIDYRAALGWAVDFLMFTDEDGTVTVTNGIQSSNKHVSTKTVMSKLSESLGSISVYDNEYIMLTGSYPVASYFVFRDYTSSIATDTLYSLKIANPEYPVDDSEARSKFYLQLGVSLRDDRYDLVSSPLSRSEDDTGITGIYYQQSLGYYLEPEVVTDSDTEAFNSTAKDLIYANSKSSTYYIPLVKSRVGAIYDCNYNQVVDSTGAFADFGTPIDVTISDGSPSGVDSEELLDPSVNADVIPAVVGFNMFLLPEANAATDRVLTDRTTILYGTLKIFLTKADTGDAYKFISSASNKAFKITKIQEEDFTIIFRATNGIIVKYDTVDMSLSDESVLYPSDTNSSYAPTVAKGTFDWANFSLKEMLTNIDDGLTIAIIFILNLLPRFFMFVFMLLICLAVIHDVPVWKRFCTRVFDPYKLITVGRQTVDTIRVQHIVVASIIALAAFGLFQNGLILDIISWIVRAVTGILNR